MGWLGSCYPEKSALKLNILKIQMNINISKMMQMYRESISTEALNKFDNLW